MRVLIAGAGIGGLTAALALHANGTEVTVIEGVREPRPLGVGINVLPHAVRELIELGLGDDLIRTGVATTELVYCHQSGRTLFTEPRGLAGGYRWPQYSVHRGRLQMLLLAAVRDRLGPDAVRTGTPLIDFTQDDTGVRVRVPDGELTADVLVGADGLHSVVRRLLHPGPDPLRWSGITMWRGVARTKPWGSGRSMAIVRDGRGTQLVTYPIGPDEVNWVVQATAGPPGPLPGDANWNAPGRSGDVLPHLAGWDLGWLDVRSLIENGEMILEYPMVDRDPLPVWGEGRVTLLGDAAHPMYPVGANGASQAIVDARVLADELVTGPDGLAGYEKIRRDATAAVVQANREMQRTDGVLTSEEIARITRNYRKSTNADSQYGGI